MTPVDDLKDGMFVAICGHKIRESEYRSPFLFEWTGPVVEPRQPDFDGRPLEILAVCLPFLCVTDGKKRFAIDVRKWDVQRISRRYAEQMQASETEGAKRFKKRPKKKEKPDPGTCPRCGGRL